MKNSSQKAISNIGKASAKAAKNNNQNVIEIQKSAIFLPPKLKKLNQKSITKLVQKSPRLTYNPTVMEESDRTLFSGNTSMDLM